MMRSLFLSSIFVYLMVRGLSTPFVAGLVYVWVEIVKPQDLAYSLIGGMPLAFIAGIAAILLYLVRDRRDPPRFTVVMGLMVFFAIWITFTTAIVPAPLDSFSWSKWNWVIKVYIFAVFIPYLFRSRVQMEALIAVIVFSVGTVFFSAGIKTALGGGGYGMLAILGGTANSGLSEGSTLATVCVMLIPLILYLMRFSIIFPIKRYSNILFLGLLATAILTTIGTTARTGLIAGSLLMAKYLLRTKQKVLWIVVMSMIVMGLQASGIFSSVWAKRMSTVEIYNQDSSALGRIAVWKWTLGFVSDHPFGGGFDAYRLNRIASVTEEGVNYYEPGRLGGKAFHNIYFEVLGEQGIVGFLTYIAIISLTLWRLRQVRKKCRDKLRWAYELAVALGDSMTVFMIGGCFIGIAYQPYVFYILALAVSLEQYVLRYERGNSDE
jgi:putative inorganic carbon (HCO3(-)) transporter